MIKREEQKFKYLSGIEGKNYKMRRLKGKSRY
jgi:hypothetical protein